MRRLPPGTRTFATTVAMTLLVASHAAAQALAPGTVPRDAPAKGDVIPAFETLGVDGKASRPIFSGWNRASNHKLPARGSLRRGRSCRAVGRRGPAHPQRHPRISTPAWRSVMRIASR